MLKTKIRLFNISSSNAENGSFKSKVNVNLPDLSFHNEHIQNIYMSVDHCEVPNSFYIINYTNNQIVIDNTTYIIPVGNYNVNTFITVCQAVIPSGFTITYDSITNKFTFLNNFIFEINGSSTNSTINKIIGLDNNDYFSIPTGLQNELIMPYMVNFLPIQRINFRSNFFNINNYNSSDGSSDVFLPLQNNTGQLSMINYINQTQTEYLIQDRSITNFIITVTDDYNNLINFNNIDWTMTMLIKMEYLDFTKQTINDFKNIINTKSNIDNIE